MNKIKLAIVDDNELMRKSLVALMLTEKDFECILVAENGKDLLEKLKTAAPDIILMDIRMPIMDGITATDHVKELFPRIKIIAFSQYDYESNIVEMYIHGVKSFIGKEDDYKKLLTAIRTVQFGGLYMTDHAGGIIQKYLSKQRLDSNDNIILSEDEKILLNSLCKGHSSTQIGDSINKSPRTVEKYRVCYYPFFGQALKIEICQNL